ncbi:MAG: GNAT family N-acetyltransferase [Prevotellaceae bacterium]|nr:GNAT family N-acetyltransferase [Prevotellaceae bacterium]
MQTNNCYLRPFAYDDAATILHWCKDRWEFRLWSADRYKDFPASSDDMKRQYSGANMYPLTMVENDRIVGHLMLKYPSDDKTIVRFCFVIVNDALRGKGYGKKIISLAIDYAKNQMGAKTITLGVFCDNLPAFECYKNAGFTVTSCNSFVIDGEEWKGFEMALSVK